VFSGFLAVTGIAEQPAKRICNGFFADTTENNAVFRFADNMRYTACVCGKERFARCHGFQKRHRHSFGKIGRQGENIAAQQQLCLFPIPYITGELYSIPQTKRGSACLKAFPFRAVSGENKARIGKFGGDTCKRGQQLIDTFLRVET
jgi:hypothetical protein